MTASLFPSCLLCTLFFSLSLFFSFSFSFRFLSSFVFFLFLLFFVCFSVFCFVSFTLCTPHTKLDPGERVRGASGHQEHPKAFPMGHMNRMLIVYMHSVRTVCKRSDYERARAKISSYLLDGSRRAAMGQWQPKSELQRCLHYGGAQT